MVRSSLLWCLDDALGSTTVTRVQGPTTSTLRWEGPSALSPSHQRADTAVSVVKRCDGCIAHHARGAAKAGATPGQVAEMLAVALLMDGGTASVYAPRAWEAFLEMQAAEGGGAG